MHNDTFTAAEVQAAVADIGVNLDTTQAQKLVDYYEATMAKNRVMNLTAIVTARDFLYKHIVDSYMAYRADIFTVAKNAVDLGTGGGFPGVPLAIYTPHVQWTMIDATAKKLRFIEETVAKLGLSQVKTLHGRAEDIGRHRKYREQFDIVVSRAVASLPVLLEWGLPLVRVGGHLIAMKGPKADEELAAAVDAIEVLGATVTEVSTQTLPGMVDTRSILVFTKERPTPKTYPRKPGKADKAPIRK